MPSITKSASHIGAKTIEEIKQLLLISLYIYLCLVALQLYAATITGAQSVSYALVGYAAVKALLLGKFILLGHWLHIGERLRKKRLIVSVLYQALALLILLLVLSSLEELIMALVHGQSIAAAIDEFRGAPLIRIGTKSLVMLLVLLPYVALRQLAEIMKPGELRRIFLARRA